MIPDAQTADQPAPDAEDEEPELDLAAFDDAKRPRRVSPTLKKAIAYKRDRRLVAEDPRWARNTWPRIKPLPNRVRRQRENRALEPALGTVSPEIDDLAPAFPTHLRPKGGGFHANVSLGQWVHDKFETRYALVGASIARKISEPRFHRRLIPFLESLIAGHHGHSVALAVQFERILNNLPHSERLLWVDRRPYRERYTSGLWKRALIQSFEEQPEWEARLRAWIAEVAPEEPTQDEPAWRRIRRHRANRPR